MPAGAPSMEKLRGLAALADTVNESGVPTMPLMLAPVTTGATGAAGMPDRLATRLFTLGVPRPASGS